MERKNVSNWKVIGPAVLAVLGVMALAVGCAGGGGGGIVPASTQSDVNPPLNSVSVTGFGEASGTPDVAYIQLGVDKTSQDVGQAVSDTNKTMEGVMAALDQFGVAKEDIQTTGFNVWPEDRYDPQTGMPTGERVYHVQNMVNIKVRDISQTGKVIESALNAGANQVFGLSFGIDDTSALEAEARTDAVADAKARAEQLAGALGLKIGDPIIVSESYGDVSPQYAMERAAYAGVGGGGGTPPVSEGQLMVSATVSVTFELVK
jgi:uncharacterized protein YggE